MTSEQAYEKKLDPRVLSYVESEQERDAFVDSIMKTGPREGEREGSFALAYAVTLEFRSRTWSGMKEKDVPELRLVVMGTSTVARNGLIYMPYNNELVMNSLNWLAGEEDLKMIRSPQRAGTRINIDNKQQDEILYLTVMILPELFMILGLAIWWRRR